MSDPPWMSIESDRISTVSKAVIVRQKRSPPMMTFGFTGNSEQVSMARTDDEADDVVPDELVDGMGHVSWAASQPAQVLIYKIATSVFFIRVSPVRRKPCLAILVKSS